MRPPDGLVQAAGAAVAPPAYGLALLTRGSLLQFALALSSYAQDAWNAQFLPKGARICIDQKPVSLRVWVHGE